MSQIKRVYRQGDLILLEEPDAHIEYMTKEGEKLAVGSENGNKHELSCKVFTWYNTRYVVVQEKEILKHPQHPHLVIEPGVYRVAFVRDYAIEGSVD